MADTKRSLSPALRITRHYTCLIRRYDSRQLHPQRPDSLQAQLPPSFLRSLHNTMSQPPAHPPSASAPPELVDKALEALASGEVDERPAVKRNSSGGQPEPGTLADAISKIDSLRLSRAPSISSNNTTPPTRSGASSPGHRNSVSADISGPPSQPGKSPAQTPHFGATTGL